MPFLHFRDIHLWLIRLVHLPVVQIQIRIRALLLYLLKIIIEANACISAVDYGVSEGFCADCRTRPLVMEAIIVSF